MYDVKVVITYRTDDTEVTDSVSRILDNTLPYMVDNVEVKWEVKS